MVEKKKKKYKIVLGSLYGDEGKGTTVQWLCKQELDAGKKPVVVRFSGGAQAAHTVKQKTPNGEITHICSSLGAGVLLGVDTYLDEMFYLDPIMLMNEIDALKIEIAESGSPLGKEFVPKIWINDCCRIVTPYDVIDNRKDQDARKHGTCGKGVNSAFKRYISKFGINPWLKMSMKYKGNSVAEIFKNPQEYLDRVKDYYDFPKSGDLTKMNWDLAADLQVSSVEEAIKKLDWMFCDAINKINKLIIDEKIKIRDEDFRRSGLYDTIIYEGSQGLLLDMENGFDPWTTSSRVGLNGIPRCLVKCDKTKVDPVFDPRLDVEVYLVMRTYLTRHGQGANENHIDFKYGDAFFTASLEAENDVETNIDNKFQGTFHRYVFDVGLLYRALDRHHLDNYDVSFNMVFTHADSINRFVRNSGSENPEFKLPYYCVFNKNRSEMTDLFPVIDADGNVREVPNVFKFKDLVVNSLARGRFPLLRKGLIRCWYSDNPYSEFKPCC